MIEIAALTDIPDNKRRSVVECLDDLLTFKDAEGRLCPVITGYNWYVTLSRHQSVITLCNIHGTEAYKQDMLKDLGMLGYDSQTVLRYIREKGGAFLHDLQFSIRDDNGVLLPGLRIKDTRTNAYLDLGNLKEPLIFYPQFEDSDGCLVEENEGWEIDIPFSGKRELMPLVGLFLRKSGMYVYDENGQKIQETEEEYKQRLPWTDAYETPVLLLGETAVQFAGDLPQFVQATRFSLLENSNEISFVIHKSLEVLRNLPHYEHLLQLGFREELCLGNKSFIVRYVDKKR